MASTPLLASLLQSKIAGLIGEAKVKQLADVKSHLTRLFEQLQTAPNLAVVRDRIQYQPGSIRVEMSGLRINVLVSLMNTEIDSRFAAENALELARWLQNDLGFEDVICNETTRSVTFSI